MIRLVREGPGELVIESHGDAKNSQLSSNGAPVKYDS